MSDKYIEIELVDANGEKYRVGYPESAGYFESTIHSELKTLKQEVGNPPAVLDWVPDVRPTVTLDAAKEIGIAKVLLNRVIVLYLTIGCIFEIQRVGILHLKMKQVVTIHVQPLEMVGIV